jgi:cyclin D1/2/4, plant
VTMLLGLQDLLCTEDVESPELVQSCVGSSIVDSNSGLNGCSTSSSFLDDDKEVFSRSIETESDNLIRSRYRSRLHSHSFEFLSRANSVAWILKVIFFGINCLLYWINFFRNMFYSLYISANKKIVQARAHHRFLPVTAYLAVNYMDRFLSLHRLLVYMAFF